MTLWSTLFPDRNLLYRRFFNEVGATTLIAAPGAAGIIRVSASGGGCTGSTTANTGPGGGAAFARTKTTCAPDEEFDVYVGTIVNEPASPLAAGQSRVRRKPSDTVICQAGHGYRSTGGLVADCIGDVKRAGFPWVSGGVNNDPITGASAGDDEDVFPLGFGGPGGARARAAWYGGGGYARDRFYQSGSETLYTSWQAGAGLVCVEFFRTDPGY